MVEIVLISNSFPHKLLSENDTISLMNTILTTQNILFAITLISILFAVYKSYRDPQAKSETTEALLDQRMKYINDSNDMRFRALQETIAALTAQNQNHIHTLQTTIDMVVKSMNETNITVAKLSTVIEERIPRGRPQGGRTTD